MIDHDRLDAAVRRFPVMLASARIIRNMRVELPLQWRLCPSVVAAVIAEYHALGTEETKAYTPAQIAAVVRIGEIVSAVGARA